jgi:hypothetical protein
VISLNVERVPVNTEPAKIIEDGRDMLGPAARGIDVLDT